MIISSLIKSIRIIPHHHSRDSPSALLIVYFVFLGVEVLLRLLGVKMA